MKSAEKNIFIYLVVGILAACGGYLPAEKTHWPVNPAEMHSWQPPDETILSARRANQLRLDGLTGEIGILFVNHATLSRQELAMIESMPQTLNQLGFGFVPHMFMYVYIYICILLYNICK